jgi:ribonuclease HI
MWNYRFKVFTDASILCQSMGIGIFSPCLKQADALSLTGLKDINRAELAAIYFAVKHYPIDLPISIYSDSQTAIRMLYGTQRIVSKYEWLYENTMLELNKRKEVTEFHKVKGHSGNYGNTVADFLARMGTKSLHVLDIP